MKLISSFFSSSSSSSNNNSSKSKSGKKGSKGRSMNRSDTPSFGSSTTTSSADSFARATAVRTPRTVFLGRNASGLDAEYWSNTSGDFSTKAAAAAVGGGGTAISSAVSELFCVFDRDGDGKITKEELALVLRRLGKADPPTEEEVVMMMAEVDRDGDGCISLEEFGVLGTALVVDPTAAGAAAVATGGDGIVAEAAAEEELRDAFGIFDEDGDGKISAEELLQVFLALGDERCTLEECRRMIGGVDSDGDGFVCFDDFVRMMDGQERL